VPLPSVRTTRPTTGVGRVHEGIHYLKRTIGLGGALAVGLTVLMATPALADSKAIAVPSDFDPTLSDTRATGHYEVQGTGLRIWTTGSTSTDKVAEYVDTETRLAGVGEPTLNYTNTTNAGVPGFQLVVDFDDDGTNDGILVGEPGTYGNDWWVNNAAKQFVKDGAPSHVGGSGSTNHGTLDQWRTAFPEAEVTAFGFSLGSGVKGDGVLNSITFAGDDYTFRPSVTLTAKDQCYDGGWTTGEYPAYKNQGECVSSFAKSKSKK
jgi:hypothetical protein